MAEFKIPSIKEIRDIAGRAAFGDTAAYDQLAQLSERMARAANTRMRRLEAAGKTGDAYKRAREILGGGKRFSQAHTGSVETLAKNLERSTSFLRKKESKISGIREVDTKTARSFFGRDVTQDEVNKLNRILESKAWPELKKIYGGTDDLREAIKDLIVNNDEIDEILDMFDKWDPDDPDAPDIIEFAEAVGLEF